ncbi:hypothetical protein [Flavobacterium suzhouense]|uniref:Lipocalin-like domain-containing protein n=1 Tax=Flavobacterium suzhouense TaxID=1529638 RepID=A0ABW5NVS0_9FLAO
MKNLLLSVFLFITASPMWSQAVAEVYSEKDLQGKWKLVTYREKSVSLDLASGKATIDEPIEKTIKHDEVAAMLRTNLESEAEHYQEGYLDVSGKNFKMFVHENLNKGTFRITRDKNINQVIVGTFKDKTKTTVPVKFKDGRLIIEQPYTNRIFTFERIGE